MSCGSSCGDSCECKRGKRGKRGHRGDDGAPGPAGPASGLLKFSGEVQVAQGQTLISFLGDAGVNITDQSISISPPSYPVAIARNLRNLATNLFFTVLTGQQVTFELIKNLSTAPVVVAAVVYGPGEGGIKTSQFGPVAFVGAPTPDTFDLRVTTVNIASEAGAVSVSATVGVE